LETDAHCGIMMMYASLAVQDAESAPGSSAHQA
jgi:hypothetical protein